MSVLGWILAVFGTAFTVFGIRGAIKGRRIRGVPFRRPSELLERGTAAAGPGGMVSTEGHVDLTPEPLVAPMSGRPCLAFELVVERTWEQETRTETGAKKRRGKEQLVADRRGSLFQLGDGAGAVLVDAREAIDAELERSHTSTLPVGAMIPGTLTFGALTMPTPAFDSASARTLAFAGTERLLPPCSTLFALGRLTAGPGGLALGSPPDGKLLLSASGRDALLRQARVATAVGLAGGALLLVTGAALAFAPHLGGSR